MCYPTHVRMCIEMHWVSRLAGAPLGGCIPGVGAAKGFGAVLS